MRAWVLSAALILGAVGCAGGHETPDAHEAHEVHWSYSGDTGPEHWGELSPDYAVASTGRQQSPIDISDATPAEPVDLEFHYEPSHVKLSNNGHTIVEAYDKGSYVRVDGTDYHLIQLHFHSPSEHTIDQRYADMELHLVHADNHGELAVVGIMLVEGEHYPALDTLWARLPQEPGASIELPDMFVNAAQFLPASRRHYRYDGSLTTPPCTEGVTWLVMQEWVPLDRDQLDRFRQLYHGNNRPVQPLYGRTIISE